MGKTQVQMGVIKYLYFGGNARGHRIAEEMVRASVSWNCPRAVTG